MGSKRWDTVRRIFEAALEMNADERSGYVERACDGEEAVRGEVEHLLGSLDAAGCFLQAPDRQEVDQALAGAVQRAELPGPGSRISAFTLIEPLASGGMGTIWIAEQDSPRRRVALKLLRSAASSPDMVRRFQYEAEVLARLRHPGIAQIYEAGLEGDMPWFAMELIDGASDLLSYVEEEQVGLRRRLVLVLRICEAVHYGHQHGVIHRDLKPGNLLVDREGHARVIDFGVARATDSRETQHTQVGEVVGTLRYMSPEQLDSDPHNIDTRSDVYSMGVVLYELLTGQAPFDLEGRSLTQIARIVRDVAPPRPSQRRPGLPRDLDWVVLRAMEKEPERRYASASEMAADLGRFLSNEPVLAGPPSSWYRCVKFVRRNRTGVAAAVVILLLLIGALIHARYQRDVAEEEAAKATAVADFMVGLFASPDPAQLGRDVKVVDVLGRADEMSVDSLGKYPGVESLLRNTLGSLYHNLGLLEESEQQLGRAYELRREEYGADDPQTLKTLASLGLVRLGLSHPAEAEAALTEAYEAQMRILGEDHLETLRTLNSLAMLKHRSTQFDEAEQLYRRSIELHSRTLGPDDLYTLTAQSNLAALFMETRRLDEAEEILVPILESLHDTVGPEHPRTIHVIDGLAGLRLQQGNFAEARELMTRALDIRRQMFAPEHPDLLNAVGNLGVLHHFAGEYADAERLMRECMETRKRAFPPGDAATVLVMCNLANVLEAMSDDEGVTGLVNELIALRLGETASDIRAVVPFKNMGEKLLGWGRFADARALWSDLLAAQKRLLPEGSEEIATLEARLSSIPE